MQKYAFSARFRTANYVLYVFSCANWLRWLAGWLAGWLAVNVSAAAVDPCSLVTLQILGLGSSRSIILTKFANFSSHGLSNRGTN